MIGAVASSFEDWSEFSLSFGLCMDLVRMTEKENGLARDSEQEQCQQ